MALRRFKRKIVGASLAATAVVGAGAASTAGALPFISSHLASDSIQLPQGTVSSQSSADINPSNGHLFGLCVALLNHTAASSTTSTSSGGTSTTTSSTTTAPSSTTTTAPASTTTTAPSSTTTTAPASTTTTGVPVLGMEPMQVLISAAARDNLSVTAFCAKEVALHHPGLETMTKPKIADQDDTTTSSTTTSPSSTTTTAPASTTTTRVVLRSDDDQAKVSGSTDDRFSSSRDGSDSFKTGGNALAKIRFSHER